jgi:hypothetical protein
LFFVLTKKYNFLCVLVFVILKRLLGLYYYIERELQMKTKFVLDEYKIKILQSHLWKNGLPDIENILDNGYTLEENLNKINEIYNEVKTDSNSLIEDQKNTKLFIKNDISTTFIEKTLYEHINNLKKETNELINQKNK